MLFITSYKIKQYTDEHCCVWRCKGWSWESVKRGTHEECENYIQFKQKNSGFVCRLLRKLGEFINGKIKEYTC